MTHNAIKRTSIHPHITNDDSTRNKDHPSVARTNYLNKIEHINNNTLERSVFKKIILFLKDFFHFIISKTFLILYTAEYNRMLLAQENVIGDDGAFNYLHKKLFLEMIKDKQGEEFDRLREGISSMIPMDTVNFQSYIPGGIGRTIDTLYQNFSALDPDSKKDFWIDLSSYPGKHAMKGRFYYDNENLYFQMSNSGAGTENNPSLHPTQMSKGKYLTQSVIQWGPLKKEAITRDFFKDIIQATIYGETPADAKNTKVKKEYTENEHLVPIQAIYDTLKYHLKNPKEIPIEHPENKKSTSPFWSTPQMGASCAPNSFWSLARVILNNDQFKEIRSDIRLKNFTRNYTKLHRNPNNTFRAIAAYEQVTKLIRSAEKSGFAANTILSSAKKQLEAVIPNIQMINNNLPPIIKKVKATEDAMEVELGHLRLVSYDRPANSLNLTPKYTSFLDENNNPITIQIKKDDNGAPLDMQTATFFLYEAFATGNKEEVKKHLSNFKKVFYEEDLQTFKHPNTIAYDKENILSLFYLASSFANLSAQSRRADMTSSGRVKQLALACIAKTLTGFFNIVADASQDDNKNALFQAVNNNFKDSLDFKKQMKSEDDFWHSVDMDFNFVRKSNKRGMTWHAAFLKGEFVGDNPRRQLSMLVKEDALKHNKLTLGSYSVYQIPNNHYSLDTEWTAYRDKPVIQLDASSSFLKGNNFYEDLELIYHLLATGKLISDDFIKQVKLDFEKTDEHRDEQQIQAIANKIIDLMGTLSTINSNKTTYSVLQKVANILDLIFTPPVANDINSNANTIESESTDKKLTIREVNYPNPHQNNLNDLINAYEIALS